MATTASKTKKKAKEEKTTINLRVSIAEKEQIQALADKYTFGNTSTWIKYASRQKPKLGIPQYAD